MKVSSLGIVVVAFLTTGTLVEIAKNKAQDHLFVISGDRRAGAQGRLHEELVTDL